MRLAMLTAKPGTKGYTSGQCRAGVGGSGYTCTGKRKCVGESVVCRSGFVGGLAVRTGVFAVCRRRFCTGGGSLYEGVCRDFGRE
eukprot:3501096-Rhodomonas_salina.2